MKSILVIDDDSLVLSSIIYLLKAHQYRVYGRSDAKSGLESARLLKPDLILCDVIMPDMTGYELLEELRQDETTANIPFIFLTSKTAKRDVLEGIDLGADHYLSKPVEQEELLATLATRFADLDRDRANEVSSDEGPSDLPDITSLTTLPEDLEREYPGWWLAIEPESGRHFLGKSRELAYESALRAYPNGIFLYHQLEDESTRKLKDLETCMTTIKKKKR